MMKLPPPPFDAVASLLPPWNINNDDGIVFESPPRREQRVEPKLDDLLRDIQHDLFRAETNSNIESIVIAGEGEPTLRP